jgi:hypothetical protein
MPDGATLDDFVTAQQEWDIAVEETTGNPVPDGEIDAADTTLLPQE